MNTPIEVARATFEEYAADVECAQTPMADIQARLAVWQATQFGAQPLYRQVLGAAEEVGELADGISGMAEPEWREIPEYEGWYDVSDHGEVRRVAGGKGAHPGEKRALRLGRDGYLRITLSRGSKADERQFFVHRLVAAAFIGPCPEGFEVNHRDGDKLNNGPWNLEYVTPSENQRHSVAIGLKKPRRGEAHHAAVLRDDEVTAIRARHTAGESAHALASEYGVSRRTVQFIVRGETWMEQDDDRLVELRACMAKLDSRIGRLAHAVLKMEQQIRGMDDRAAFEAAAADAIADAAIFLMQASTVLRIDFEALVKETAVVVMQRDFRADKLAGGGAA